MSVPFKIPDEKVLFLRHPPTGYTAAENCNLQVGYTVAGDYHRNWARVS
jgi:hypothetical protein